MKCLLLVPMLNVGGAKPLDLLYGFVACIGNILNFYLQFYTILLLRQPSSTVFRQQTVYEFRFELRIKFASDINI